MDGQSQDNRGDHNTNVGTVEGDVNVFITKGRGVDAALLAGLWVVILFIFSLLGDPDHPLFEPTLLALVILAVVSVVVVTRRQNTRPALLFVALGLLIALTPMLWSDTLEIDDPVQIPNVIGLNEDSARDDLRELGLNSKSTLQPSNEPKDRVIGQVPTEDTTVEPGTTVTIIISTGPETQLVTVPSLVGKDEQTAANDLRKLGLNSKSTLREAEAPVGRVTAQTPPEGATVELGDTVNITVSTGPPETLIEIPRTKGTLESAARSVVADAGLSVSVRTIASATSSIGRVVRSDPPAGTMLPEGSPVELIVSSGTAPACDQLRSDPSVAPSNDPVLAGIGADGSMTGFEPELIEALLSEMCERQPEYVLLTTSDRFLAMSTAEVDIMMTAVTDRSVAVIEYTTPYVLLDGSDGREGRALAVQRTASASGQTLRVALDAALVELIENGTWLEIHERNLGVPDYSISEMLTFVIPDG